MLTNPSLSYRGRVRNSIGNVDMYPTSKDVIPYFC
jgi:hypothetical protein